MKLSFLPTTYLLGSGAINRMDEVLDSLDIEGKGLVIVDHFFESYPITFHTKRNLNVV